MWLIVRGAKIWDPWENMGHSVGHFYRMGGRGKEEGGKEEGGGWAQS